MSGPGEVGVRPGTADDAADAARLHANGIAEGFLTVLGPAFLRRLYRRIACSASAFLLVASHEGEVVGFVAVAHDTRRLYRDFLRHDAIAAGLAALPAVLRSPRRVLETLRYGLGGDDGAAELPAAEILSIAVDGTWRGDGIGSRLVDAAVAELASRGIRAARVVTAVGNTPAVKMYERAGFARIGRVEVHRGAPQELLVWR